MKILVTGHQGFIGSHAVDRLIQINVPYLTYEWGDDFPSLDNVSHVMHFGAISSTTETDIEKILTQNYDFSVWLLNMCDTAGIHFQWSSSASIYGLGHDFKETANPDPRTPYAWSKYLFERYISKHHWAMPVQTFRYFNVYGDCGEDHKAGQASPYHTFKKQAIETKTINVFENSDQYLRDFVHVDCVLDTQFKFLHKSISGTWNIGSGCAKSFLSVAEEIAAKYSAEIQTIPMPTALANSYQQYTCADLTNLRLALNE